MFGFGEKSPAELQDARNKALLKAAKRGETAAVAKLLDEGASLEVTSSFWVNTPLIAAASQGHTATVRLLLDRGARIDAVNAIGDTALNGSVQAGHVEVVSLLLERGASLEIRDHSRRTPLDNALNYKRINMVRLIAEHMAKKQNAEKEAAVKAATAEAVRLQLAAEKQAAEESEAKRLKEKEYAEVVVFTQKIGDLVLEDAFNFASFERLTFVRKGPGGDVQSMARQGFAEINNQQLLRKAFEEHVKRGGTVRESDVFPNGRPKLGKHTGGPA